MLGRIVSWLFVALLVAGLLLAPNLLWLSRSTAHFTNVMDDESGALWVRVFGEEWPLGQLAPGESRFRLLPEGVSEGTFEAFIMGGEDGVSCQDTVEGAGYHVEVEISEDGVNCEVEQPLVSRWLLGMLL